MPLHPSPLPDVARAVVFAPHADDEVLGCGGTLHRLAAAGTDVQVVVVTDGALGRTDDTQNVARRRQDEARMAASILGYAAPEFWDLPDRGVRFNRALTQRMRRVISRQATQLIFAPALTETHPDHQAVGLSAIQALRDLQEAQDPNASQTELWFYEVSSPLTPNRLIDISAAEPIKQQAIQCFASQLAFQPYHEQIAGLNRFRSYSLGNQIRSAEAFLCVTADALPSSWLFQSALTKRLHTHSVLDPAEMPLVSVVLDLADDAVLPSTLESLAAQSYPNLEFLVVRPKSTRQQTGAQRTTAEQFGALGVRTVGGPSEVPQETQGVLIAHVQHNAVVAPDTIRNMVGLFQKRGVGTWGQQHCLRADKYAMCMVLADQWFLREGLTPESIASPEPKTLSILQKLKQKLKALL